ncbi:MAG TPA: LysM peptidoglycan-binding domain-containing protein [Clostridiales bacterium]|nr:LysM peptidoglycan-binding domain-containing protein [Clostridiales bacterium]
MIETVYNNNEKSSNGSVQMPFKMPKNIRQVGKVNNTKRIFIEDYAMSFLRTLAKENKEEFQIAVLLGTCVGDDKCNNIFIQGAVKVEDIDLLNEGFTNDIWTNIYEDIKTHFSGQEIVGWFVGGDTYQLESDDKIRKLHIDNFAGQDKVLLTLDSTDDFGCFSIFERNQLVDQKGYYIYYIKNEEMQLYIMHLKKGVSEESKTDDKVTREIRAIMQEKKSDNSREASGFMYIATTVMALVVLMIGGALLNNFEKMRRIEQTLDSISKNINDFDIGKNIPVINMGETLNNDKLPVEVISAKIEKENKKEVDNEKKEEIPVKKDKKKDIKKEEKEPDVKKDKTETKTYKVEMGETLASISYKLYDSYNYISKIREINNIENEDLIIEGQILILP